MKKIGIFLLTLFLCTEMTTGVLFAQTITPTPTPKTTQPTGNPTPAATQVPMPTSQVTVTQAPQAKSEEPSKAPAQVQQTQQFRIVATPTPVPPTPTPKPKPLVLITNKKPPEQPISKIIAAPFDLVMNALQHNYYNDQVLAPIMTKTLLGVSFLCLMSGTILLSWPSLIRLKKRMLAPKLRDRKSIPYLIERV